MRERELRTFCIVPHCSRSTAFCQSFSPLVLASNQASIFCGDPTSTIGQVEETPDQKQDKAATFIAATKADIRIGGDRACYIPALDFITLPPESAFKSREHFLATSLHECGHWTGAKSRLDRDLKSRFNEKAYAAEELIAELNSAFLCAHLGIRGELRHAEYITLSGLC
jgi:antirestriction protein ArdC